MLSFPIQIRYRLAYDGALLSELLRAGVVAGRLQTRLRPRDTVWEATRVEPNGQPYSGHPTPYYPKAVQLTNGEVVVVGHVGGDDGYRCGDQSIVGLRFTVPA